jgi:hypothetical protein
MRSIIRLETCATPVALLRFQAHVSALPAHQGIEGGLAIASMPGAHSPATDLEIVRHSIAPGCPSTRSE